MDYRYYPSYVACVQVRRVGGSLSLSLPPRLVRRLHLAERDSVFLYQQEEGFLLTAYDPYFDIQMEMYERLARPNRNALRRIARDYQTDSTIIADPGAPLR